MRWVFASLISIYQKWFSPWKGYSCAHRCLHGGYSCSEAVKQFVLNKGLISSIADIRERFRACRAAASIVRARATEIRRSDLDCGLSGCGRCDGCSDFGVFDSCSGGAETVASPSINFTIPIFRISFGVVLVLLVCLTAVPQRGKERRLIPPLLLQWIYDKTQ